MLTYLYNIRILISTNDIPTHIYRFIKSPCFSLLSGLDAFCCLCLKPTTSSSWQILNHPPDLNFHVFLNPNIQWMLLLCSIYHAINTQELCVFIAQWTIRFRTVRIRSSLCLFHFLHKMQVKSLSVEDVCKHTICHSSGSDNRHMSPTLLHGPL